MILHWVGTLGMKRPCKDSRELSGDERHSETIHQTLWSVPENTHPAGLLQPLPIPEHDWEEISMDFIEWLARSGGKTTILVLVYRFTKFAHFIPLSHPFTAKIVLAALVDGVFKLYGLPRTIVSDWDIVFTCYFWKEFWTLQGSKLHFSTSFHSQTDSQTEVVNRCLETYLRCLLLT